MKFHILDLHGFLHIEVLDPMYKKVFLARFLDTYISFNRENTASKQTLYYLSHTLILCTCTSRFHIHT